MRARIIYLNTIKKYWQYDTSLGVLIPTPYANARGYSQKYLNFNTINGYLLLRIEKINYMYHRILYQLINEIDCLDDLMTVDHIDGDKSNNKIDNLRLANKSQNGCNRLSAQRNNKIGYKNIVLTQQGFIVSISRVGNKRFQKSFKDFDLALACRDEKLKEYHGEFMNLGNTE